MKKNLIKIIILILVFVIGITILSEFKADKDEIETTVAMPEAKLPIISLSTFGNEINLLHGYVEEMEANYMRDTITPLEESRVLGITIEGNSSKVTSIGYEVRSLDTTRLVEETQVEEYKEDKKTTTASLKLKSLLEMGKEYILIIRLNFEDGTNANYYTRIINTEDYDLHAADKLEFVKEFNQKTFNKENAEEIERYLESNSKGDNSTLHKVNINSKFEQATWGNLDVSVVGEIFPEIKEIDKDTASIALNYTIAAQTEDEKKEYYNVSEYYRVRHTAERMYLLDFKREMNEIFSSNNMQINENRVTLGIGSLDVNLKESNAGDYVACVWENELLSFEASGNKVSKVFSFRNEITDLRTNYNQNDIEVLRIDDDGNIDFIVYGYMNRGDNEGRCGISLYRYEREHNTIEEKIFIVSTKPYQLMEKSIKQMSYLSSSNIFYFMQDGIFYSIDVEQKSYKEVVSNITNKNYVASESGQFIAWQNENSVADTSKITILNLQTGRKNEITADSGKRLQSLGFMNDDFIYGEIYEEDIFTDAAGIELYPMYKILIADNTGDILEQYEKPGIYVVDTQIENNMIQLTLIRLTDEGFEPIDDEHIVNNSVTEEKKNKITHITTETKQSQAQLILKNYYSSGTKISLKAPKMVEKTTDNIVSIKETKAEDEDFYVYAEGMLQGIYSDIGDAVNEADYLKGVVVSANQEYVWERGNRKIRTQISSIEAVAGGTGDSLAVCLDAILVNEGSSVSSMALLGKGETALSILKTYTEGNIYDLKGASMSAALYYVSKGNPVLALSDTGSYLLIAGYDELNIIVMDPQKGTLYRIGMNDSTEMFENAGNMFIAYLK